MANMSYCRFQNTLQDLIDCKDDLEEREGPSGLNEYEEPLSIEEMRAAKRLIELCGQIYSDYGSREGVCP